jgi:hypothetical protein
MSDGNGVVHETLNPARSWKFWAALGGCFAAFAIAVLAGLAWRGQSASIGQTKTVHDRLDEVSAHLDEQIALNKTIAAQLAATQQEAADREACVRRYSQHADDLHWAYVSTLGDVLVSFTTYVHGSPTQLAEIDADIAAVQAANAAAQAAANERDAYTAQSPPPLPCPLGAG